MLVVEAAHIRWDWSSGAAVTVVAVAGQALVSKKEAQEEAVEKQEAWVDAMCPAL
jgi:hypothetical protein